MLIRTALAAVLAAVVLSGSPAQADTAPTVTLGRPQITTAEDGAPALLLGGRLTGPANAEYSLTPVLGGHLGTRTQLSRLLGGEVTVSGTPMPTITGRLSITGVTNWTTTVPLTVADNGLLAVGVVGEISGQRSEAASAFPWFPQTEGLDPTRVTLAIPLTAAPYTDDAAVLRLTQLVSEDLANQAELTWLLDPALIPWLNQLNTTNSIALVTRINSIKGEVVNLPYALANVPALVAGSAKQRIKSVTGGFTLAPAAALSGNAWPVDDIIPLVSNQLVTGNSLSTIDVAINTGTPTAVWDAAASECLALQCADLHVAMMTAELPGKSRHVMLLAPMLESVSASALLRFVQSVRASSWGKLTKLDSPNFVATQDIQITPTKVGLLPKNLLNSVDRCVETAGLVALVTLAQERPDPARCRLGFSTAWQSQKSARDFVTALDSSMSAVLNSLSVQSARTVLVGTDTVDVPITIRNESEVGVSVSAAVIANKSARFASRPSTPIFVAAGQRVTVVVPVTVRGTGDLVATASILASDGSRVGQSATLVLRPTAYTRVAGLLAGAALVVMLILMVLGVRKRRRQ